jgi:hypothetical protein
VLIAIPVVVVIAANETLSPFDKPCAVKLTKSPVSVNVQAIGVVNGVPTPVTVIPTNKLDVSVCVITVEPAVVPHDVLETAVSAPGFVVIVSVCEVPKPKFENNNSSAAFESLQEPTENEKRKPVARIFVSERQVPKIELKLVDDETVAAFSAGTDVKDEQVRNVCTIFVTLAVLNNGTDVKDVQPLNIFDIFVTDAVLNNGTDVKDGQL